MFSHTPSGILNTSVDFLLYMLDSHHACWCTIRLGVSFVLALIRTVSYLGSLEAGSTASLAPCSSIKSNGESWQHPGSHLLSWEGAVSPLSQALLQVCSLESSARLLGCHHTPGPHVKQRLEWHFGDSVCWRGRHERPACPWAPVCIPIKLCGHTGLESNGSGNIAQ